MVFINEYDFFINGILKTSSSVLQKVRYNIRAYYTAFDIPKKGGKRNICAINRDSDLYVLQKNLCLYFLDTIPLPKPAIGFVKNENYIRFLRPHIGKKYFLRMDIRDFFHSITKNIVEESFKEFFQTPDKEAMSAFLDICMLDGHLPQGAVSSPAVSNVVFRRIDQRILKYCQNFDVVYFNRQQQPEDICYTRYADDLLFSSNAIDFSKNGFFAGMITRILKENGFSVNKQKTRCSREQISLSGFVLGEDVHLSRKRLHELNKILYFFDKNGEHSHEKYSLNRAKLGEPDWLKQINALKLIGHDGEVKFFKTPEDLLDYLCGYRSFLLLLLRENPEKTNSMKQLEKKIKKLEDIIDLIIIHI